MVLIPLPEPRLVVLRPSSCNHAAFSHFITMDRLLTIMITTNFNHMDPLVTFLWIIV